MDFFVIKANNIFHTKITLNNFCLPHQKNLEIQNDSSHCQSHFQLYSFCIHDKDIVNCNKNNNNKR